MGNTKKEKGWNIMEIRICCIIATLFAISASGVACKSLDVNSDAGDAGFDWMEGACGMDGTPVECVESSDCPRLGQQYNYCTVNGKCVHDMPGRYTCLSPGRDCQFSDQVCGESLLCTSRCVTHSDCEDYQFCLCVPEGSYCDWYRCYEGDCGEGTHPHPGSLICAPDSREGECFSLSEICPDGYTRIGPSVFGSAACARDASAL